MNASPLMISIRSFSSHVRQSANVKRFCSAGSDMIIPPFLYCRLAFYKCIISKSDRSVKRSAVWIFQIIFAVIGMLSEEGAVKIAEEDNQNGDTVICGSEEDGRYFVCGENYRIPPFETDKFMMAYCWRDYRIIRLPGYKIAENQPLALVGRERRKVFGLFENDTICAFGRGGPCAG